MVAQLYVQINVQITNSLLLSLGLGVLHVFLTALVAHRRVRGQGIVLVQCWLVDSVMFAHMKVSITRLINRGTAVETPESRGQAVFVHVVP